LQPREFEPGDALPEPGAGTGKSILWFGIDMITSLKAIKDACMLWARLKKS
jgi:hypothetical protein